MYLPLRQERCSDFSYFPWNQIKLKVIQICICTTCFRENTMQCGNSLLSQTEFCQKNSWNESNLYTVWNYGNSLSHFFGKNFMKTTILLKKLLTKDLIWRNIFWQDDFAEFSFEFSFFHNSAKFLWNRLLLDFISYIVFTNFSKGSKIQYV